MKHCIKNLFNKKTQVVNQLTEESVIPESIYPFVEQYTLVSPKNMMMDYELWELCKKMPVAYEIEGETHGWQPCVKLDTKIILPFLRELSKIQLNIDKKTRTVSVIYLNKDKNKCLYVLQNLQKGKDASVRVEYDDGNEKDWHLYMTPEIRKAVIEQMKIHSL